MNSDLVGTDPKVDKPRRILHLQFYFGRRCVPLFSAQCLLSCRWSGLSAQRLVKTSAMSSTSESKSQNSFVTQNFLKYSNLYHHQLYDNEVFNPGALLTGLLKHETTAAGVPTPKSSCPPASPPPPDLRNFREALTSSLPPPQATP